MANKIAIVVHGGAGDHSEYLKQHQPESTKALKGAIEIGYKILTRGGTALKACEEAVKILEDDPYFNAGRGSVLNVEGKIEMDAAIMDGKTLKAGAVAMVEEVKNPIELARIVMTKTKHVLLSGYGALKLAKKFDLTLKPASYFMTQHQWENFLKNRHVKKNKKSQRHGTVGAVAVDKKGNCAAATSTGGTSYTLPGRIGDSCIIGAGCYADNDTCAISCTGEGEYIMRGVIAHTIAMMIELEKYPLQSACDYVVLKRHKFKHGDDVGLVGVNRKGDIAVSFNTLSMRYAWLRDGQMKIVAW